MRLTDKMKDDERHIIQRILRGETALYEHFLNTYGQQVFILVARIVSNQEDAEELTQDVFLKAFQHLSSFKGTSSFSTWIYSIAAGAFSVAITFIILYLSFIILKLLCISEL